MCAASAGKRYLSQSKNVNNLNLQTCRIPVVRTNSFLHNLKFCAANLLIYALNAGADIVVGGIQTRQQRVDCLRLK